MRADHVHFTCRVAVRWGLAAVALAVLPLIAPDAQAGYAQLAPPPGWTAGGGAAVSGPGGSLAGVGGAANDAFGGWRASGALNAGGRPVQIPAAGRFAANAGRYAARGLFLNPWLLGAVGVAWLASQCIAHQGGQWVVTCGNPGGFPQSDGFEYLRSSAFGWRLTRAQACTDWASQVLAQGTLRIENARPHPSDELACIGDGYRQSDNALLFPNTTAAIEKRAAVSCPAGWYITPAGCVQTPPPQTVTQQQVEDKMAPVPIPPGLPQEIPGVPLPIEIPIINPSPGANPVPQPLRVPQGAPQPIPNTDPQQWRQPVLRIVPSPAPSNPWQVDLQPEDVISNSPDGMTQPETVPSEGGPESVPKDPDLCAANPDILACSKPDLDVPDGEIPRDSKTITFAPESVLGGGSCPADRSIGSQYSFSYAKSCEALTTYVRPLAIAVAGWMAIVIIFGVGRPEV